MSLEPLPPHNEGKPRQHARVPAVCLRNVHARRGGKEVLREIDLCVEEGVFLGVIGPNGGGKTTLLNVILGALPPSKGDVEVFGEPPNPRRRRETVGYVPQQHNIPEHFPARVLDVVLMGAYGACRRLFPIGSEYKQRARHLLQQVRMDHLAEHPIGHLSGGQQQRVLIARALVTHPRLLLLDEPFRGLDASGQIQLCELLVELKRQYDLTVIMVSHNINHITKFADRIACLYRSIHWHDHSELISHEVLHHMYKCELESVFSFEDYTIPESRNPFRSPSDPSKHHH